MVQPQEQWQAFLTVIPIKILIELSFIFAFSRGFLRPTKKIAIQLTIILRK